MNLKLAVFLWLERNDEILSLHIYMFDYFIRNVSGKYFLIKNKKACVGFENLVSGDDPNSDDLLTEVRLKLKFARNTFMLL